MVESNPMEEVFTVVDVQEHAKVLVGRGNVGKRFPLITQEARDGFAWELAASTLPLTNQKTADCGDARRTIRLADGTTDPGALKRRVVPQLFGGLGLAATKAIVAADALIIRDAKDFTDAYEKTIQTLIRLGYEDGGHEGCKASGAVKSSVEQAIPRPLLLEGTSNFTAIDAGRAELIDKNIATKRQRLEDGFFDTWDPARHADYLSQRFPQNFSYLEVDPNDHETHGHHASGVYAITQEGYGFAKNDFIERTGRQAFAISLPIMRELALTLGGSAEERTRMELGFYDDAQHVPAGLAVEGMPIFAQG